MANSHRHVAGFGKAMDKNKRDRTIRRCFQAHNTFDHTRSKDKEVETVKGKSKRVGYFLLND